MRTKDISFYITSFFSHYLVSQRNVSENTVKAYRDAFLLLFSFMCEEKGIRTDKLKIDDINRASVLSFLDWLEYWAERTAGLNSNEFFSFSETVQVPKAPDNPDIMGRKMGWIE